MVGLDGNPVEGQDLATEYVFTYKGKPVKNIKKAVNLLNGLTALPRNRHDVKNDSNLKDYNLQKRL